jgi:hypothetical protein
MGKAGTDSYLRRRAVLALVAFETEGNFESGYGGEAWGKCTEAAVSLYDAIAACSSWKGTASEVILAAHAVVNSAHNNGPFLNKFIEGHCFDQAARGDLAIAVEGLVAMYRATQSRPAYTNETAGKPWPKRAARPAKPPVSAATIQWNLRQDGTAIHAQYGRLDKYQSATLPIASLSAEQQLLIASCVLLFPYPCLESMASSKSVYWPGSDVLTAETIKLLFPNG